MWMSYSFYSLFSPHGEEEGPQVCLRQLDGCLKKIDPLLPPHGEAQGPQVRRRQLHGLRNAHVSLFYASWRSTETTGTS
jgi:hypothetical protein